MAQVVNPPRRSNATIDTLRYWNQVAIDASGVDHIPGVPGGRQGAEQLGPGRSARAMAIVHIAMFDAVNAITGNRFRSYTGMARETRPASLDAAIATAARDTLVQLFREQAGQFNILYNAEIARIPPSQEQQKNLGIAIGNRAATRILGMRTNDGSQIPEPRVGIEWITSNLPGRWRQDPISQIPLALGAQWTQRETVRDDLGLAVPLRHRHPRLNSAAYTTAFNEVKRLGGDVVHTPTQRSQDQTNIGIYWAYDGTPSLCAPPRLYNQIATEISKSDHERHRSRAVVRARQYGHGRCRHRILGVEVLL